MAQLKQQDGFSNRPYRDTSTRDLFTRFATVSGMWLGALKYSDPILQWAVKHPDNKISKIIESGLRHTAAKIFFGGESLEEVQANCDAMLHSGRGVILDYLGRETGEKTPKSIEETKDVLIKTIAMAAALREKYPDPELPIYAAVKISTLASEEDLKYLSENLVAVEHHERDGLDERSQKIERAIQTNLDEILTAAKAVHINVFVDAEYTWMNPAIYNACLKAARSRLPVDITVQAYLKDTPELVNKIMTSELDNLGLKLVRGAYMNSPAEDRSLVHPTKDGTDRCYDDNLVTLATRSDLRRLTAATHNRHSIGLASDLRHHRRNGIDIRHGKLKGIGEYTVVGGMPTADYVPFTINDLLGGAAYLGRRGGDLMSASDGDQTRGEMELSAIWQELILRSKESSLPFRR